MHHTPFALAMAMACSLAAAADGDEAQRTRTLGTITVTGGQPTSLPTQIPTTIEGVTRQQIEHWVNATDSEDALKYLPSLLVRKRYAGDYNHAVLSTRASGAGNPARSLVYADGILLSNLLGNGPTNAPRWMLVTPEEIDRVDVLYGPFSAAYPGNSVGAVVDYVTRMPRSFEAHAKVLRTHSPWRLYNTDGVFGAAQASASLGNRSGAWSWWLNVHHGDSEGHPQTFVTRTLAQGVAGPAGTAVTGAVAGLNRSNQPWLILGTGTQYRTRQDHLKAKLAYDIAPTVRATYTFGWWHNDATSRAQSYLRDVTGNAVYSGTVNVDGRSYTLGAAEFGASNEDLAHFMHGLSVKSNTRGTWDWELAASRYAYHRDRLRAAGTALPSALAGGPGRIADMAGTGWATLAAKAIWRPQGPAGAHVVDVGLQRDAFRLRSIEHATSEWIVGAPGARNSAFVGDSTLTSLYAQDNWKLAPRWKAVLGARLEEWRAFGGATSNAAATVAHAPRRETFLSPKAALAYQWHPQWTLKASVGRAVRMPTVSELFQGGINGAGQLVNNDPALRPEDSWTTELSAERELGDGLLRLTAFFERTRDALYSQTNTSVLPNVVSVQNVGRIRTQGLELSYQERNVLVQGLELSGSLTWADSRIVRNDNFPASVGKRQPRVPEWRATALATWRPDAHWSYTLGLRYSGRQYNTLDNSDPNGFAYMGTSNFFVADVRVRYQLARHLSAAFGIDNLNNHKHWNFHPYPQRTFSMELKADL